MWGFTFAVSFPFLVGIGMVAWSFPPVNRFLMKQVVGSELALIIWGFYLLYLKKWVEPTLMAFGLAFLPFFIWAFFNLRGYQP